MTLDQSLVDELNRALNEAEVRGLRGEPRQNVVRLLVEVSALPPSGPVDPDPRRALVLGGVNSILVWLARDRFDVDGGALRLASLDALEEFFASLRWSYAMYGWEFIDVDDPREGFPGEPSLAIPTGAPPAAHSLRWFTECGRDEPRGQVAYVLGGVVWFDSLRVERADGTAVDTATFAADGGRWWDAFFANDPRTSVESQREDATRALHWRSPGGNRSTKIPGRPG
jgi:hypothetical protein